jgi:TfoX/Sxy family transcriptional regulator of competence genes
MHHQPGIYVKKPVVAIVLSLERLLRIRNRRVAPLEKSGSG